MNRGGLSLTPDVVSDAVPQGLGATGVPDSRVPGTVNYGEIAQAYAGEGGDVGALVLTAEVLKVAFQVGTMLLGAAAQYSRLRDHQREEIRASTMAQVARFTDPLRARFPRDVSALQAWVRQALRDGPTAVAQLARMLISNPRAVVGTSHQPAPTARSRAHARSAWQRPPSSEQASRGAPVMAARTQSASVAQPAPAWSPQDRATAVNVLSTMLPSRAVLNALGTLGVSVTRTSAVPLDSPLALGAQNARLNALRRSISPSAWTALASSGLAAELKSTRAQLNAMNVKMRKDAAIATTLMNRGSTVLHSGRAVTNEEVNSLRAMSQQLSALSRDIATRFAGLRSAGDYAGAQHPVVTQVAAWQRQLSGRLDQREITQLAGPVPPAPRASPVEPAPQPRAATAPAAQPPATRVATATESEPPCRPWQVVSVPVSENKEKGKETQPAAMSTLTLAPGPGTGPVCRFDVNALKQHTLQGFAEGARILPGILGRAAAGTAVVNGVGAAGGALFELGLREVRTGSPVTASNAYAELLKLRENPDAYLVSNYVNAVGGGLRIGDQLYNISGHLLEVPNPNGSSYWFRRVPEDMFKALQKASEERGLPSERIYTWERVSIAPGEYRQIQVEIRPPFRNEPLRDASCDVSWGKGSRAGSFLVHARVGFGKLDGMRAFGQIDASFNYAHALTLSAARIGFPTPGGFSQPLTIGFRQFESNYKFGRLAVAGGAMAFNEYMAKDHTDPAALLNGRSITVFSPRAYIQGGHRTMGFMGWQPSGLYAGAKTNEFFEFGGAHDFVTIQTQQGVGKFTGYFEVQNLPADFRGRVNAPLSPKKISNFDWFRGSSISGLVPITFDPTIQASWTEGNSADGRSIPLLPFGPFNGNPPPLTTSDTGHPIPPASGESPRRLRYDAGSATRLPSPQAIRGAANVVEFNLVNAKASFAVINRRHYLAVNGDVFDVTDATPDYLKQLRYLPAKGPEPARLESLTSFSLAPLQAARGPSFDRIVEVAKLRGWRLTVPAGTVYLADVGNVRYAALRHHDGSLQRFDIEGWSSGTVNDFFRSLDESKTVQRPTERLPRASGAVPNRGDAKSAGDIAAMQLFFGQSPWDVAHTSKRRDAKGEMVITPQGGVDVLNRGNNSVAVAEIVYQLATQHGLLMPGQRIRNNAHAGELIEGMYHQVKGDVEKTLDLTARLLNRYDLHFGSQSLQEAQRLFQSASLYQSIVNTRRKEMGLPALTGRRPSDYQTVRGVYEGFYRNGKDNPSSFGQSN